jgi:Fic family protein
MLVLEQLDQNLYDRVQEKNLIRQYDLLTNCIEIGLQQDHTAFDKYMLWSLNHVAVAHISQFGGRFRQEPIYVGDHIPPHFDQVPELMDRFISFVHENWFIYTPTELAAYALWRLNWIHPFIEGNGRTARAASYYLLCVKSEALLGAERSSRSASRRTATDMRQPWELLIGHGQPDTWILLRWKIISPIFCRRS